MALVHQHNGFYRDNLFGNNAGLHHRGQYPTFRLPRSDPLSASTRARFNLRRLAQGAWNTYQAYRNYNSRDYIGAFESLRAGVNDFRNSYYSGSFGLIPTRFQRSARAGSRRVNTPLLIGPPPSTSTQGPQVTQTSSPRPYYYPSFRRKYRSRGISRPKDIRRAPNHYYRRRGLWVTKRNFGNIDYWPTKSPNYPLTNVQFQRLTYNQIPYYYHNKL